MGQTINETIHQTASGEMSNLTYGRDAAGRKSLLTNYLGDIAKAVKTLDSESNLVITAVRKNWIGYDADKYLKEFENEVKTLKSLFNGYKTIIESALAEDAKQFSKMQQQNANNIFK